MTAHRTHADRPAAASPCAPTVSVIVPTYRRPDALRKCLGGLRAQTSRASEVLVALREDDAQSPMIVAEATQDLPEARPVMTPRPGVVAAMQAGLDASQGDIVAIIDDDAVPRPDWLDRIVRALAERSDAAGVGGKDVTHVGGQTIAGEAHRVGVVQWFGRHIGNHHIGVGPPRCVDVLKGVNCAYRGRLLKSMGFDHRLRGQGAQVHWEMCLGLALRKAGWKLIYDPAIIVDHYPAQRYDADQREGFSYEARFDEAHNETLALLAYLPPAARGVFCAWSVLIGTRATPGLVQWARFALRGNPVIGRRLRATLAGRLAGRRTWRTTRASRNEPPPPGRRNDRGRPV